ncbi:LysR family transcriptional regulator [Microbacterium sp. gxy059]|uniref:LysR family transcriptional regulator n=1 Tax=Microbacterium sp. gxy059 TaxID=2957199 RepID=UPI003D9813DF
MELQQMRYVVAVAEERSFTRAAERCFVVQSSLSHQIKALERELGVELFARSSRRVEPTAAGEAFLPAARASLEAAERAVDDAAAATGRVRGTLTIGMIPTVTALDVPEALRRFRQAHPDVRVRLRGGGSDGFIAAIGRGEMDVAVLGLAGDVDQAGVASRVLARERLAAVVSAEHRLAPRRRLRLSDLAEEIFVDFPAGTPGRAQSDIAFAAAGVRREVMLEAVDAPTILDLVRADLAVALLPPAVVPEGEGLVAVPVADGPTRTEHLAWSGFNPSPATRAFLAMAGEGSARVAGEPVTDPSGR